MQPTTCVAWPSSRWASCCRALVHRCGGVCVGWLVNVYVRAQCAKVVALLAESYNPHVRYGSALALGISAAASANADALRVRTLCMCARVCDHAARVYVDSC
jgi:hypothetical protein